MVELAQLLESLDLSQYVETFAKSDIDAAALLDLIQISGDKPV